MPVTAADYALGTAADFLAYLSEPSDDDGANSDKARRLINAYSKAIHRFTKRAFKPTLDNADKLFAYTGNGHLSMSPHEARVIHTVTLYTDMPTDGWQVLTNQAADTESQWRPNPRNKSEEGTYWSLTLPEIGPFHPYFDMPVTTLNRRNLGYQVTINADWGVGAVPSDVEMALFIACANGWRNPEGFASRNLGPLGFVDGTGAAGPGDEEGLSLPRSSRALLAPYRRRTVR